MPHWVRDFLYNKLKETDLLKKKNFIAILAVVLVVILGLFVYHAAYQKPQKAQTIQQSNKMIASSTLELKNGNKVIVKAKVPVVKGETALQQLKNYATSHHIQLTITGSGKMAYVTSLENLKASGKKGWMFSVNGKEPNVGAGATIIKPNQTVVWFYTSF